MMESICIELDNDDIYFIVMNKTTIIIEKGE